MIAGPLSLIKPTKTPGEMKGAFYVESALTSLTLNNWECVCNSSPLSQKLKWLKWLVSYTWEKMDLAFCLIFV